MRRFVKGFLDLLTVKFLTGFGQRPQHLLGSFGLIPVALGLFGMLFLAANAGVRLASDHTVGASSTTQMVIAILSVGLLLCGSVGDCRVDRRVDRRSRPGRFGSVQRGRTHVEHQSRYRNDAELRMAWQ